MVKNLPAVQETQEMEVQSWVRKIRWRRKWQPTSVFLPGKPHVPKILVGYSLTWHKESDTTERPSTRTNISKALCAHAKSLQSCPAL